MAEILSLLIDSINNADRVEACVFLIVILLFLSTILLPMWFDSEPPPIATAIMSFIVIFVCIFPINYFSYASSEYREKAAKLCDQTPGCDLEQMYSKAKMHVHLN